MSPIHTLLLAQAEAETFGERLAESGAELVIGFFLVLVILGILSGITSLVGLIFARQALREARKASAGQAPTVSAPPALGGADDAATAPKAPAAAGAEPDIADDPLLLPVLAAAVHAVIGHRPHRIVSVRAAGTGWAQEGRREIFSTRRLR